MKRLIICGDRHWPYYRTILDALRSEKDQIEKVIEGEARGADTHARMACKVLGITCHPIRADWDSYEGFAGPIRNGWMRRELMEFEGEREVWAFHLNFEKSKGTKDMVEKALKWGITTRLYHNKEGDLTFLLKGDRIRECPACGGGKTAPAHLAYKVICKSIFHRTEISLDSSGEQRGLINLGTPD